MNHTTGGFEASDPTRSLPESLRRFLDLAVLPDDRPDLVRTKRMVTGAMWAASAISIVSISSLYASEAPWAAAAVGLPFVSTVIALFSMWIRPTTYPGVMHLVGAGTLAANPALSVLYGGVAQTGITTVATIWGVAIMVGAAAVFADRRAHIWAGLFVVSVVAAHVISQLVEPIYTRQLNATRTLVFLIVASLTIYLVLYYFARQTERLYTRSEDLLLNILPKQIADRLRAGESVIADRVDDVTILFADLVGSTPMAEQLTAVELVEVLNSLYGSFDDLTDHFGLEKIRTIGDSYMVVGGLPTPRPDHMEAVADLALAMCEELPHHIAAGFGPLEMRFGIHTGTVVAGVIGKRKFSYDLWGDAVNTAARMESHGVPGEIQVTEAVYLGLSDRYHFEERGSTDIKGKGSMTTYLLKAALEP